MPTPGWPLLNVAIEPQPTDRELVLTAITTLIHHDDALVCSIDAKSGQILIEGPSEEFLSAKIDALRQVTGRRFVVSPPQVAYRERLCRAATIDYTQKNQTGGSGQFARVKIEFAPGEPGTGFVFENKIVGGAIPKEFIPGVEKGLTMAKENGLLAGFPVIDVSARLIDDAYHDIDSNVLTFQIAAQAAFRELKEKGDARLLEPIMKLEVTSPDEYVGSVIGDLNSRRGMIQGQYMRGNATIIRAMVPLANMFGYMNTLRSFSQGRASYVMEFDHYAELPGPENDPPSWPSAAALRA